VGFGLAEAARALRDDERGAAGALLAGAALALALASVGPPLWPTGPLRQQANTYLDLLPLPAFDAIWPETPAFYRDLAARPESERRALRLVELPALTTRTRHLYRHYQRLHGGVIWLAPLAGELPLIPDGPYVALQSRDWVERSAPDYVVVHLDIASEIARYWRFVFDRAAVQSGRDDLAAYMARQSRYGGPLPEVPPGLVQGLTRLFGEPVSRDDVIAVWSTRAAAPPGDAE
jgi:hypothetical protein